MKSSSASEKQIGRTVDVREKSPERAVPLSIYRILRRTYGEQKCFLDHDDPFQLLASAILSAQCTDLKVNRTTPVLFKAFPDIESFAKANTKILESIIRPLGL